MPKLTEAEHMDLGAHKSWREFGKQFGWQLNGSSGDASASFFAHDRRYIFEISKPVRKDIEHQLHAARADNVRLRGLLQHFVDQWETDEVSPVGMYEMFKLALYTPLPDNAVVELVELLTWAPQSHKDADWIERRRKALATLTGETR